MIWKQNFPRKTVFDYVSCFSFFRLFLFVSQKECWQILHIVFFIFFLSSWWLATMHFHFLLDLTLLLRVSPNRLTISCFHRHEGLPCGRFRSLGYHSITWAYLWSSWRLYPNSTSAFGAPRSDPLINLDLPRSTIFPSWIFPCPSVS